MIRSRHGGRLGASTLGAVVSLALILVLAAPAAAQSPFGNVVNVAVPRPAGDEVVLVRFDVEMARRSAGARLRDLPVRRVGGSIPSGYGIAAVRAIQRGSTVRVRLAAVRTGDGSRGPAMRLRLRIGGTGVVYRHAGQRSVRMAAGDGAWRGGDCRIIRVEAAGWRSVPGLRGVTLDGERYSARTAVGAGMEAACQRNVPIVSQLAAEQFLGSVDPGFVGETGGEVEGFYATWVKNPDGNGTICVYVRGDWGGTGELLINGGRTPFTLDDTRGLARVDTVVAPGEYPFTVRWRQPDGTFRQSASSIRVPAGAVNGEGPPAPYSAAGPCG